MSRAAIAHRGRRAGGWRRLGLALAGLGTACALAGLAGCAADKPKPTPLESVTAQLAGRQVWQAQVDSVQFPLGVAVAGDSVVVAGTAGGVQALQAATGQPVWRGEFGQALSAAVGSDGRFAAAVTVQNELVVLDGGRRLWSARLASRVATPPLVAGERVFVMGVDRVVHAFDALDGRRLWTLQRPGEALTLAQAGLLVPMGDTLVAGIGAVAVGIEPTRGSVRWELPLTSPRGTNEVERLNDLVGPALRVGSGLCARAFQTAVGCMDLSARPSLRWSRTAAGVTALGGDADLVFGADSSDRISAWRAASGDLAWTNERLLYRSLSAPVSFGRAVVFGDLEGQLHFLARDDGRTLLRLPTDGAPVAAAPVVVGNTLVVVTRRGGVFAFRQE